MTTESNAHGPGGSAAASTLRIDIPADAAPLVERTLPALLRRQAERFGGSPCLEIAGAQWRHADAALEAARVGAALKAAGIVRGDRVALMGGNRVETLAVFLGCGWIGAISAPINTASMGPQIAYFLADSGAKLLVIEAAHAARLQTADLSPSALEAIWVIGDPGAAAVPSAVASSTALKVSSDGTVKLSSALVRRLGR